MGHVACKSSKRMGWVASAEGVESETVWVTGYREYGIRNFQSMQGALAKCLTSLFEHLSLAHLPLLTLFALQLEKAFLLTNLAA